MGALYRANLICWFLAFAYVFGVLNAKENDTRSFAPVLTRVQDDTLTSTEAPLSLKQLIRSYKDLLDSALKMMMERVLPIVMESNISPQCLTSMFEITRGVRNFDDWALSLLDASAKFPVGILDGTSLHHGEYDECLRVVNTRDRNGHQEVVFRGQYCTVQLSPPDFMFNIPAEHRRELHQDSIIPELKSAGTVFTRILKLHYGFKFSSLRLGLCLPSSCSNVDLQTLLVTATKNIHANISVVGCEVQKDKLTWRGEQIVILAVFVFMLVLVIAGSGAEYYLTKQMWASRPEDAISRKMGIGLFHSCIEAFSFRKNIRDLSSTKTNSPNPLPFVCGMRVISVLVCITGYTFGLPYIPFLHKLGRKVNHVMMRENFMHGLFGNGTIPTETLIFTSGLLAAYQYGIRSPKGSHVARSLTFLALTVLRSFGGMILAIGTFLMLPLIGDGPEWNELVNKNVDVCRSNWWRNLLFIQNFWDFGENCMYQTYLQSVVVQCTILAVLVLWITYRHPKTGIAIQIMFILLSAAASGTLNALKRYPPALAIPVINADTMFDMMSLDLIKPYHHVATYFVGMLMGYLILQDFSWNVTTKSVAWVTFFASFFMVFYVPFHFPYWGDTYMTLSALYAASYRIVWGINLGSFVLLCAKGGAGFLGDLCSWKVFVAMDRMTYLAYVIHPLVLFYYHGQSRINFFLGYPEIAVHSLGFCVGTYVFSVIAYVIFAGPLLKLYRVAIGSSGRISPTPSQQYVTNIDDLPSASSSSTKGVKG